MGRRPLVTVVLLGIVFASGCSASDPVPRDGPEPAIALPRYATPRLVSDPIDLASAH